MHWSAGQADCFIYTYKEGLLSRAAHDLKLKVTGFNLEVSEALQVTARFDPSSLRVVAAMKDGQEAPGVLSERDRSTIEQNLRDEVLEVRRFPALEFRSTQVVPEGSGYRIQGTLLLHGASRPLQALVRLEAGAWVCGLPLHQPDFGIKPFSAMLGTLKVRPDVRLELRVPLTGTMPAP